MTVPGRSTTAPEGAMQQHSPAPIIKLPCTLLRSNCNRKIGQRSSLTSTCPGNQASLHSSEWISSCQAGNNLGICAPCLITECSAIGFYRSSPYIGTKEVFPWSVAFLRININNNVQPFSQIGCGITPSLAIQPLLLMVCHSQNICVFTEWERYWLCSLMLRVGGKTHGSQFLLQGKFNYYAKCVSLSQTNQQPS